VVGEAEEETGLADTRVADEQQLEEIIILCGRRDVRPMCGSQYPIFSPDISKTKRKTPCAAGCCGPKFKLKAFNFFRVFTVLVI
jgi:hypothetical protein